MNDSHGSACHEIQPPLRSCAFCRQRRKKCDRQEPCSNCQKLGRGTNCVYPPGPGRSPKRPRQHIDPNVLSRLDQLESIINRLQSQVESQPDSSPSSKSSSGQDLLSLPDRAPLLTGADPPGRPEVTTNQQLGRLVIDDTRSYYVSNISWASLGNEVEELRSLLAEPTPEDNHPLESNAHSHSSALGSDSAILGFEPVSGTLQRYHPLPPHAMVLLQVFKENVAPVVRTLHMPTTEPMYHDAMASLSSRPLDKNVEALLFAIDYSAVISMQPQQCMELLGLPRDTLLDNYRFAVRQALARANLLQTESIIVLQAAVLFVEALRNEDDSRTVWSLTSLIVHIARSMGLHRDGTTFGLRPFETELRRRLWYHICLLDIRSSEYHGYEPIVNGCAFDTKLPLHINDSDLKPDMESPPSERDEACEMTLCLVRSEYMRLAWKVNYAPSCRGVDHLCAANAGVGTGGEDGHMLVGKFESRMQERYLCHCDTGDPFHSLTSSVTRLMIARSRIHVHQSQDRNNTLNGMESDDTSTRDYLFQKTIEVLQMSSSLLTNKDVARWKWHTVSHVQWNAVAFALSEICSRPPSPDCDRAWSCACTLLDEWKVKKNSRTGSRWRPIRRLLAKARYVRELQKVSEPGGNESGGFQHSSAAPGLLPPSSSEGTQEDLGLAGSDWGSSSSVRDMIGALGADTTHHITNMWDSDTVIPPFPVPDSTWLGDYQF